MLNNLEIAKAPDGKSKMSILMPSFNLETQFEIPNLVGAQLTSGVRVATAHMAVNLNLIRGNYQEEGLTYY